MHTHTNSSLISRGDNDCGGNGCLKLISTAGLKSISLMTAYREPHVCMASFVELAYFSHFETTNHSILPPSDAAVGFAPANYTVGEGMGSVTLRVLKTGTSVRNVSVQFCTEDGSATGMIMTSCDIVTRVHL